MGKKGKKNKIILYSTTICPQCLTLKTYLENNKIDFTLKDVMKDVEAAKEMVEDSGQMGIPTLKINGEYIVGLNIAKVKELLNISE